MKYEELPENLPEEKKIFLDYLKKVMRENNYSFPQEVWKEIKKYYDIPRPTFDNTVDESIHNLNAMVVIAFCKRFGIDIYDIYRSKMTEERETKEDGKIPAGSKKTEEKCDITRTDTDMIDSELPARFYGTFYGYFFNSQEKHIEKGTIDMFTVNIQKDEISMLWSHRTPSVKPNNPERTYDFSLRGRVIHNQGGAAPDGMIVMSFNSEKDDAFCTIAYSKFALNGKLHFRRGALLIQHRGGEIMPMVQSFILTDEKIDLEDADKKKILQGALTLTHKSFLIEKSKLDEFMDSKLLTKYFDNISYESSCREYVELNEKMIQSIGEDMNDKELYQTLFNIKAESFDSQFYVFPETDHSWHYIACLCDREEPLEE